MEHGKRSKFFDHFSIFRPGIFRPFWPFRGLVGRYTKKPDTASLCSVFCFLTIYDLHNINNLRLYSMFDCYTLHIFCIARMYRYRFGIFRHCGLFCKCRIIRLYDLHNINSLRLYLDSMFYILHISRLFAFYLLE